MKQTTPNIKFLVLAIILVSCDPDVNVDYNITNKTDGKFEVKIFGLRDQYNLIIEEYDTLVGQGEKLNIYRYGNLGSGYINPADTITIFDSIHVVKNGVKAKSDFKKFETWDYSEKNHKYGGGDYIYNLIIKSDDF
jgi:hypothetical protein